LFSGTDPAGAFSTSPLMVNTLIPAFEVMEMVLVKGDTLPCVF
jgi:hypothetical protein